MKGIYLVFGFFAQHILYWRFKCLINLVLILYDTTTILCWTKFITLSYLVIYIKVFICIHTRNVAVKVSGILFLDPNISNSTLCVSYLKDLSDHYE